MAQLDPSISANPSLLVNAQPGQGQAAANISGSSLTIIPSAGFAGVLFVTAFASDGYNTASQTFQLTVATPTLATTPTVTSETPASGATGVAFNATITATFNEAVQASTISFTLSGPGGAAVPAALSYNATTDTATLTPLSNLAASTTYTATVSGAKAASGAPMSGRVSWSFTTAASGTATFIKADTTTLGTWTGTYGSQGYDIVAGPAVLPARDTVTPSKQTNYTWTTTSSDPRALQVPGSSNRVAAAWYSSSSFTVGVNLGDGQAHDLELYFLDWPSNLRSEIVQLSDAASGKVLDTESIASFHGGEYLDWKVGGNLLITITYVGGGNAVLSGVFLDPPQVSGAATFLAASARRRLDSGLFGGFAGPSDHPTRRDAFAHPEPAHGWH